MAKIRSEVPTSGSTTQSLCLLFCPRPGLWPCDLFIESSLSLLTPSRLRFTRARVLHKEVLKPVVLLLGCNYACYILSPGRCDSHRLRDGDRTEDGGLRVLIHLCSICLLSSQRSLCTVPQSRLMSVTIFRYGMSPEAQGFTSALVADRLGDAFRGELAELMAYTAESIVFGYFGLTAVAYTSEAWIWCRLNLLRRRMPSALNFASSFTTSLPSCT